MSTTTLRQEQDVVKLSACTFILSINTTFDMYILLILVEPWESALTLGRPTLIYTSTIHTESLIPAVTPRMGPIPIFKRQRQR